MAALDLQDGHAGLAEVEFTAADACGDTIPSGSHKGSWTKGIYLLVKNTGALDCCCDPVLVTVYVNPTGHDECMCCVPTGALEFEVPSDGGIGFIPILEGHFGSSITIEYSDAMDLEVAAVTSIKGYVIA